MNKLSTLLLSMFFLAGCDYVDEPLGEEDGPDNPGVVVPRRILLEDCTGHTCNNCPEAARIAEEMKENLGDRLIIVAVHMVDGFAAPVPPLGDGEFDTDFRTAAGSEYETTFGIGSLPKGMVSRRPFENSISLGRNKWNSAAGALDGQEAALDLWFDSISYDQGTNTATLKVKAACVKPLSGNHSLTIYLLEDSIIADQLDLDAEPDHVQDYLHRHVLRDNVNGTWGQNFVVGSADVGDTLETQVISYTLAANVLDHTHCSFVAYVYSTAGTDQYEVKQAVEAKLLP